jgi:predicted anti-sigma-YlaC factor YlaD
MSGGDGLRRLGRVARRPDHWSTPHERARVRAAERLDGPLPEGEATWLEAHLADCPHCAAVAHAYASERMALRSLRDDQPEPPRDLWARTAAGIERESAARRQARREPRPSRRRRPTSLPALSALSGLAVVALVVVATAISGGFLGQVRRDVPASVSVALASQPIAPQPTAIAVGAGNVHWLGAGEDGAFAYNVAEIDSVCPHDRQPDCAPFADGHAKRVTLNATPRFVFQSPVDDEAVVVGTDATGADAVLVVALPTPDPTPMPSPDAGSAAPSGPATTEGASPAATPAAVPSTLAPTELPSLSVSPVTSVTVTSTEPDGSGLTSPEASAQPAIAIMTNVIIVGRAAAYSPDGAWFAFSARPADGAFGPDIYVWHVGDLQARALTVDHASVFASWVGDVVLGSRLGAEALVPAEGPDASTPVEPSLEAPPPDDASPSVDPSSSAATSPAPDAGGTTEGSPIPVPVVVERMSQSFLVDPTTGAEIAVLDPEWQPAVDPTGLAVVAWQGTVGVGADGLTAGPASGNLVIHPFHGPLETDEPIDAASPPPSLDAAPTLPSPSPSLTASVAASIEGSPLASASPEVLQDFPAQVVATGPIADFDARWDDTGSWLAIWVADPIDPGLGRLSLLHFDPFTGLVDRPIGAPQDVTALPGFSIGLGRLAWASPPGQGGEGSRIQIAAWTADVVGAVESIPVEGAIVVQ